MFQAILLGLWGCTSGDPPPAPAATAVAEPPAPVPESVRSAAAEPDPQRRIVAYQTLLAADPGLWPAREALSRTLAATGDIASALSALHATEAPPTVVSLTTEGEILLAGGRKREAFDVARSIQTLSPATPDGWRLEAQIALEGDRASLVAIATAGLQVAPNDAMLLYALGV